MVWHIFTPNQSTIPITEVVETLISQTLQEDLRTFTNQQVSKGPFTIISENTQESIIMAKGVNLILLPKWSNKTYILKAKIIGTLVSIEKEIIFTIIRILSTLD